MKEKIMDHILNLKGQGINVRIDKDQINDLIKKISNKKEKIDKEKNVFKNFFDKCQYEEDIIYNKKIRIKNMNERIGDYNRNNNLNDLITEYSSFNKDIENFVNDIKLNKIPNPSNKQKKLYNYWKELSENIRSLNPERKGLKILTDQQMLNRLPILLAQIQAGNNPIKLKNEIRKNIILII